MKHGKNSIRGMSLLTRLLSNCLLNFVANIASLICDLMNVSATNASLLAKKELEVLTSVRILSRKLLPYFHIEKF